MKITTNTDGLQLISTKIMHGLMLMTQKRFARSSGRADGRTDNWQIYTDRQGDGLDEDRYK